MYFPENEDITLAGYQSLAVGTAIYPDSEAITYPILGLLGEAGEMANKWKKVLRDDNGDLTDDKRDAIIAELGDVLWYIAAVARDLDANLDDVAKANLVKLYSRKDRGVLGGSGDTR